MVVGAPAVPDVHSLLIVMWLISFCVLLSGEIHVTLRTLRWVNSVPPSYVNDEGTASPKLLQINITKGWECGKGKTDNTRRFIVIQICSQAQTNSAYPWVTYLIPMSIPPKSIEVIDMPYCHWKWVPKFITKLFISMDTNLF